MDLKPAYLERLELFLSHRNEFVVVGAYAISGSGGFGSPG
jgi:hypothetical protein